MTAPRIGSLFSGVGGLDQAVVDVLGGTVAWHSEYQPPDKDGNEQKQWAADVLAYRFPGVPNLGDITTVDWSQVEPVDIICGGFPCTDVSVAGAQAGLKPGTRSGLWTHMAYAISQLRPSLVVIENVGGLLSAEAHSDMEPCTWCVGDGDGVPVLRALGAVLGDLADCGFDAEWCGVRASDVGAPHGRLRVFVVAWPAGNASLQRWDTGGAPVVCTKFGVQTGGSGRSAAAYPTSNARRIKHRDGERPAPNAGGAVGRAVGNAERTDSAGPDGFRSTELGGCGSTAADTSCERREQGRTESAGIVGGSDAALSGAVDWGKYAPAIRRWEGVLNRSAPAPWQVSERTGNRQLSARFTEWLMGLPDGWVTGVPGMTRNGALHVLGNGVVPAQASYALRLLLARIDSERVA